MRHLPLTDQSWNDADATRLVRSMTATRLTRPVLRNGDGAPRADGTRALLARTVEDEVIPRLLLARRPQKTARAACELASEVADQVTALCGLALRGTQSAVIAYVEALQDNGMSTEEMFLDLLAPTARRMGAMWEDDLCDFSDVTMGVLRLGNVVRLLGRDNAGEAVVARDAPNALLAQMPGERHGLGLAMVTQFFRRAGWHIRQETSPTSTELTDIVRHHWFGVVGLSVACDDRLDSLAADIRAIRRVSRNRGIGILVGGPPFSAQPGLAEMVGADATAIDGRQAVIQARSLLSLLAREG